MKLRCSQTSQLLIALDPIIELAQPLFSKQAKHAEIMALQPQLLQQCLLFKKKMIAQSYPADLLEQVTYALVALLDEMALSHFQPDHLMRWAIHSLQIQIFRENTAGENFFKRLEAIQGLNEKVVDTRSVDVLEWYYVCLHLGFHGSGDSKKNLPQLTQACYEQIHALRPTEENIALKNPESLEERSVNKKILWPSWKYLMMMAIFLTIIHLLIDIDERMSLKHTKITLNQWQLDR